VFPYDDGSIFTRVGARETCGSGIQYSHFHEPDTRPFGFPRHDARIRPCERLAFLSAGTKSAREKAGGIERRRSMVGKICRDDGTSGIYIWHRAASPVQSK